MEKYEPLDRDLCYARARKIGAVATRGYSKKRRWPIWYVIDPIKNLVSSSWRRLARAIRSGR